MTTKKSTELTLRDKLSRLNYQEACKLIGEEGAKWIQEGAQFTIDIDRQVRLDDELPLECLNEEQLVRRALRERKDRSRTERMTLRSADASRSRGPTIHDHQRRVRQELSPGAARRGSAASRTCSCPDFRTNTLGTCKHIMHALAKVETPVRPAAPARSLAEIRRDPAGHPLRTELLKTELLPYQLDGIAFAAGAGRAILADDMGLGKTIQGVGVAELLAREADIRRVLVVCPASLKSQWRNEIHRFCDRDVPACAGRRPSGTQYDNDCFFTICNYEQVLRDILAIEQVKWDLIILDEGQRIKNWEAKTSARHQGPPSPFALVLSGTPLENRLDDLYSVVQFIDDRRLGPAFRFFNRTASSTRRARCWATRTWTSCARTAAADPAAAHARLGDAGAAAADHRDRPHPADRRAGGHAPRTCGRVADRPQEVPHRDGPAAAAKGAAHVPHVADSTFLVDKQPPGYSSKLSTWATLLDDCFDEEGIARSCCSPNGRRCST
jgi:hypothetical protein